MPSYRAEWDSGPVCPEPETLLDPCIASATTGNLCLKLQNFESSHHTAKAMVNATPHSPVREMTRNHNLAWLVPKAAGVMGSELNVHAGDALGKGRLKLSTALIAYLGKTSSNECRLGRCRGVNSP